MTGTKLDFGKPRPALLPPRALLEVSRVLAFGARKYSLCECGVRACPSSGAEGHRVVEDGSENWKKIENLEARYQDALGRHWLKDLAGERIDDESGLESLAHLLCCGLFVLEARLIERQQRAFEEQVRDMLRKPAPDAEQELARQGIFLSPKLHGRMIGLCTYEENDAPACSMPARSGQLFCERHGG